jgi:hypothetical protein
MRFSSPAGARAPQRVRAQSSHGAAARLPRTQLGRALHRVPELPGNAFQPSPHGESWRPPHDSVSRLRNRRDRSRELESGIRSRANRPGSPAKMLFSDHGNEVSAVYCWRRSRLAARVKTFVDGVVFSGVRCARKNRACIEFAPTPKLAWVYRNKKAPTGQTTPKASEFCGPHPSGAPKFTIDASGPRCKNARSFVNDKRCCGDYLRMQELAWPEPRQRKRIFR